MRMFSNYQDLAANYTPNNLMYQFPTVIQASKLCSVEASKPYEEYNAGGKLIGYFWNYGDTLNLDFSITGEITVESDAIILTSYNAVPTENTKGVIGQRCYNVADFKSWTCRNRLDGRYIWREDDEFEYPTSGARSVYMSADDYLKDKKIDVTLYNFRMEPIFTRTFEGTSQVIFEIDPELSRTLLRGIYYCSMRVYNDVLNQTIFGTEDCKLLVK